jgi:dolichol kinase
VHRPAEPLRKSIHLAVGILPFAAWWGMGRWPVVTRVVLVALALLAVALDRLRGAAPAWRGAIEALIGPVMREEERAGILGSTLLVVALAAAFLLFPPTIALAAMLFFVVGDAAAALVGRRFGGRRWIGNATIGGSLACLVATLAVVPPIRWLDPAVPVPALVAGAVFATLVEAIVPGKYDNAAMPIVSGAAMRLLAMGH